MDAVCWSVEVLKGYLLSFFFSFVATLSILKDLDSLSIISSASLSDGISKVFPWYLTNVALNSGNTASLVQYSVSLNACISLSLSTISFYATLWTRPALLPPVLDWISLDNLNPIIRSSILLVSWLFTKSISIFLGCLNASKITSFVISLKTTLSY